MIGKGFNVKVDVRDRTPRVLAALKELDTCRVLVGVPERTTERKEPEKMSTLQRLRKNLGEQMITNAQLAYIHSHGSPINNIPARPIVEPAINAEDNKASITEEMKQAAGAALDGRKQQMRAFLRRAGMDAMGRVRAWFTDPRNGWAPNKPATIKRKGSDRPLIDTGQLRAAITYAVEVDGQRE